MTNLGPRTNRAARSRWLCVSGAIGALCWPEFALAQGVDEFGSYGRPQDTRNYESPQNWAVELRFGPYYPQADEEFNGGAAPLANTFGTSHRVMVGIEGDWQALRVPKILSIGPGFGTGYTVLSATAKFSDGSGYADMGTSLKLWVQWADVVARIDALNKNFHVPIVFSAKLGAGQALWWASKGDMTGRDRVTGTIGHGRSFGPHWALGVMFDLNFVQPERARKLDAVSDINHMYLFFEWYQLKLGSWGSNNLHVGDSDWVLGYALEF
jgi:hypothetical protein